MPSHFKSQISFGENNEDYETKVKGLMEARNNFENEKSQAKNNINIDSSRSKASNHRKSNSIAFSRAESRGNGNNEEIVNNNENEVISYSNSNTNKKNPIHTSGNKCHKDELICHNCYNKQQFHDGSHTYTNNNTNSYAYKKKATRNNIPKNDSNNNNNENWSNKLDDLGHKEKNRINEKVKAREQLTENLIKAGNINNNNSNSKKANLQESQENKTFYLHNNKEDPLKIKALEKYNQMEKTVQKARSGKPKHNPVSEYYDKCVEDDKTGLDVKGCHKGIGRSTVKDHNAMLEKQIMWKNVENEKEKFIDRRKDREMIDKVNEENMKEMKEKREQDERKKLEFMRENERMIKERNVMKNVWYYFNDILDCFWLIFGEFFS